jgi:putative methyltransferase (TIGR04325 family)
MLSAANLRNLARLLVPPFLAKPLARLWPSGERPSLEYAPDRWRTLEKIGGTAGWNTETVVQAERAKWEAFCSNLGGAGPLGFSHENNDLTVTSNVSFHNIHLTYAYVLALAAWQKRKISVLDWGGGLGHYYAVGKAMFPDLDLDYYCHEVPLMCEHGKELCPEVHFCSDDTCLQRSYDLIMINGSLGYFPDWKDVLERLAARVTNFLFLTRVLVVQKTPSFLVLQRTEGYNYHSNMLTQVFNQPELRGVLERTGLKMQREFVVENAPTIAGAPEQCVESGWLFKREI